MAWDLMWYWAIKGADGPRLAWGPCRPFLFGLFWKKNRFFVFYLQKYDLFEKIWNFTFWFVKIQFFCIVTVFVTFLLPLVTISISIQKTVFLQIKRKNLYFAKQTVFLQIKYKKSTYLTISLFYFTSYFFWGFFDSYLRKKNNFGLTWQISFNFLYNWILPPHIKF